MKNESRICSSFPPTDLQSLRSLCLYGMLALWSPKFIRTNRERTLVQMSESPNYRSATENMIRKVIKWTLRVFLGNTTLF
jgi:hypothetical protein